MIGDGRVVRWGRFDRNHLELINPIEPIASYGSFIGPTLVELCPSLLADWSPLWWNIGNLLLVDLLVEQGWINVISPRRDTHGQSDVQDTQANRQFSGTGCLPPN